MTMFARFTTRVLVIGFVALIAVSPRAYSAPGDLDAGFSVFGKDGRVDVFDMSMRAIALQTDGRIVAVGRGIGSIDVRRFMANGEADPGFGEEGVISINLGSGSPCGNEQDCGVALQDDGKIVVVAASNFEGNDDFAILRFLPNGDLDPGFGDAGQSHQALVLVWKVGGD